MTLTISTTISTTRVGVGVGVRTPVTRMPSVKRGRALRSRRFVEDNLDDVDASSLAERRPMTRRTLGVSSTATALLGMLITSSNPAMAASETTSSSQSPIDALTSALPDPWAENRRARAELRSRQRRAFDARFVAEKQAKEKEDDRARAVYAEAAAKRKTRIRLEREGELTPERIDEEVERAGRMAREQVERGLEAEEIELAEYERIMAERRATAEARNAEFLERAEDVLEASGEAVEIVDVGDADATMSWVD